MAEAETGKEGYFSGWTFFDTCCLSELVKLADSGEGERVREFVRGRDIVLPLTAIQELRRAASLANRIPDVVASANVYEVPHPTKFWDCDIWNFLNTTRIPRNILEASPFDLRKFQFLIALELPIFARAEHMAGDPFRVQIERDRQAGVDEQKLVTLVWSKVNEIARDQYRIEVPIADCRPENFPAIFTFFYLYYFRFLAQKRVVPKPNDFVDLAHGSIAPYCVDFYAEQKMVQLLRRQVKGRVAPTPFHAAKRLSKEGYIDPTQLERARQSEDMKRETAPLLPNTNLITHMEMREAILAM
ncbi:MAG TPA: hypothetical protein VFY65_19595 [Longimicrobium sp.]|nr:hypothetical protein [Longimicrobium sp.]